MANEATLARQVDGKRRITMPEDFAAGSSVMMYQLDKTTWVVRRHERRSDLKMVAIPVIDRLPDDAGWEKKEAALARQLSRRLPEP